MHVRDAVVVGYLVLANWTEPLQCQPGGQIAFQSLRDGQWEIYVMNTDGSHQTNLTRHSATDIFPAWSPDGESLAFTSDRKGVLQIFSMRRSGEGVEQLTMGPGTRCGRPGRRTGRRLRIRPANGGRGTSAPCPRTAGMR